MQLDYEPNSHPRVRYFGLLELLLIVGILAFLIAILLPARSYSHPHRQPAIQRSTSRPANSQPSVYNARP